MAVFSFDKTNKKNLKARGNYGVRVARPGYDAESCAQNQLIFNSNWPILQIAKVIDLDKTPDYSYMAWDVANSKWVDNPNVSGLNAYYTDNVKSLSVSKDNLVYTELVEGFYDNNYQLKYWRYKYKKYNHYLGYAPFFFLSEEVSDVANKVILTSVDISKDIDYPYTEGALPMISKIGDYGITSTSCFNNPRVPGLCSNMFSKLVQAVKTNETCRWLQQGQWGDGYDRILCWSPFENASQFKAGEVNKFEAFLFTAFKSPFFDENQAWISALVPLQYIDSDPFGNHIYYNRNNSVHMVGLVDDERYGNAVAYTNLSQTSTPRDDASLVILRSPMVSPEYEEVRI